MMPVFLRIGSYQLTSYVALIAVAGIVTLFYFKRFESKLGLNRPEDFWLLVNVIAISGFLGARLFDLFSGPVAFLDFRDFLATLVSNQGGLSTFGALLGVLVGTIGACRYLGLSVLRVFDYVCLAVPVGHAIARVGCFLNGCCYGREAGEHVACAVVFTNRSAALPPELLG